MASKAKEGRRIHGTVAFDLGVAVVSGRYKPGDTLPGEIEFSERLKVSRSAYREAVRMLAAKGLVESRPKTGTRVTERARWNLLDPEVLAWSFENEPSESFIRDLFELRTIVEPAAAALAALRRDGRELAQMGHALEEMTAYGLAHPAGQAADRLFHRLILQATRNAPLLSLASSIEAAVGWTTIYKQRKGRLRRDPIADHHAIFTAIADGDPVAARAAMNELIQLALEDTSPAVEASPVLDRAAVV